MAAAAERRALASNGSAGLIGDFDQCLAVPEQGERMRKRGGENLLEALGRSVSAGEPENLRGSPQSVDKLDEVLILRYHARIS